MREDVRGITPGFSRLEFARDDTRGFFAVGFSASNFVTDCITRSSLQNNTAFLLIPFLFYAVATSRRFGWSGLSKPVSYTPPGLFPFPSRDERVSLFTSAFGLPNRKGLSDGVVSGCDALVAPCAGIARGGRGGTALSTLNFIMGLVLRRVFKFFLSYGLLSSSPFPKSRYFPIPQVSVLLTAPAYSSSTFSLIRAVVH